MSSIRKHAGFFYKNDQANPLDEFFISLDKGAS